MKEDNQNNNFTDEEKELVIFRIETTPSNLHLSIGGGKTMSKEDMIDHVKKGDKLGNGGMVVLIQLRRG